MRVRLYVRVCQWIFVYASGQAASRRRASGQGARAQRIGSGAVACSSARPVAVFSHPLSLSVSQYMYTHTLAA